MPPLSCHIRCWITSSASRKVLIGCSAVFSHKIGRYTEGSFCKARSFWGQTWAPYEGNSPSMIHNPSRLEKRRHWGRQWVRGSACFSVMHFFCINCFLTFHDNQDAFPTPACSSFLIISFRKTCRIVCIRVAQNAMDTFTRDGTQQHFSVASMFYSMGIYVSFASLSVMKPNIKTLSASSTADLIGKWCGKWEDSPIRFPIIFNLESETFSIIAFLF